MCLMEWNFDQEPHEATDETGVNLRAYFDRMPNEKMRQYSPSWNDEQVIEWDGNFRDDGALFWSARSATLRLASTGTCWRSAFSIGFGFESALNACSAGWVSSA